MSEAVVVQDLFFAYEETPILSDISFSISENEFVGIIGPNGGGKTTLLLLLMGFLKPSRGKIKIFGLTPKEARESIGYVPQAFRYDRDFPISVLEVVLAGKLRAAPRFGGYRESDKEEAKEALKKMGMEKVLHAPFSELSGGQAQRVLLARALCSKPKLLFLDEPTANVDAPSQAEIYKHLDALKGEMTIVMVTHDLRVASSHVERLLCVDREIASFTPREVCEHFALGLYHPPLKRGEGK